jgi:hypothetical protein
VSVAGCQLWKGAVQFGLTKSIRLTGLDPCPYAQRRTVQRGYAEGRKIEDDNEHEHDWESQ